MNYFHYSSLYKKSPPSAFYRHTHGFTVVEVLVSIGVLLIILSISTVGFRNYAQKQSYSAVVDRIRNDITLMRQKTLASYDASVYGVYVGNSTIEFFEGQTPSVGSASNTIIYTGDFGITATSSFSNGQPFITFSRLTGEASASGTILIEDLKSSASTTFTISGSGLLQ